MGTAPRTRRLILVLLDFTSDVLGAAQVAVQGLRSDIMRRERRAKADARFRDEVRRDLERMG